MRSLRPSPTGSVLQWNHPAHSHCGSWHPNGDLFLREGCSWRLASGPGKGILCVLKSFSPSLAGNCPGRKGSF